MDTKQIQMMAAGIYNSPSELAENLSRIGDVNNEPTDVTLMGAAGLMGEEARKSPLKPD
jgi:hypothetical protein